MQVLARIETLREVEEIANTPGLVKTDQSEIDPKKFRKLNSFILWVLDKIFGPRLLCPLRGDFVHFFDFCLYK